MQVKADHGGKPIKAWAEGVSIEPQAHQQLVNVSKMPFIYRHVAVMPDCHWGMGATVGSVIATQGAIIPAAVGVDLGCGMVAVKTAYGADHLPDSLAALRLRIEGTVPHGRSMNGKEGDCGAWGDAPAWVRHWWASLEPGYARILAKHPKINRNQPPFAHLGTLGTGNHFIEVCLDEMDRVWVMLHSGSRGVGNRIGSYFIEKAKEDMRRWFINLPDEELAYLPEGSEFFADYVEAVSWAQDYAAENRRLMLNATLDVLYEALGGDHLLGRGEVVTAINCHHNYVAKEHHFGQNVWVTRKGAVRARTGDLGIIPGSMGTRSYIVRGKGNPESFTSCSHGAGRAMSRGEAKRRFSLADHVAATSGVECRKDADVIDETPAAYKDIDAVMAAQSDLVEVVHTLRQVLCVKG